MNDVNKRPPIRVTFKYNKETGEIEEFIIDDNAPSASDEFHDQVAKKISSLLAKNPEISDAGRIRHQTGAMTVQEPKVNDENENETGGDKEMDKNG